MESPFQNKKIMVTGGTGSIGREVVYELLKNNPKAVRILDINETEQIEMEQDLSDYHNVRFLLGDIRDKERLSRAIEDIDIVFHMASLKHVPACEYNPFEAIKTNVIGTQNLIDVAINEEVEKVIFTSSDKAINPYNVMGATKLLAERLITAANYYKGLRKTVFSSVRFGNVLGSGGSIFPLFKTQIQRGGPITITDPEMTRFVMSLSQVINLLFKATEMAQGGEIFILKMPALRILDLAEVMIEGFSNRYGINKDKIEIKIIGRKPGEKLFEELMTQTEAERSLETKEMFIVLPEIIELSHIDKSHYPNTKPARLRSYRSDDAKILTKQEIKNMLREGGLL